MEKQKLLNYLKVMGNLQQAVEDSNLDSKWKTIIINMAKTDALIAESRFIIDGGSLR
jgi:hypothetical protein